MTNHIIPCLWFDNQAEEAAKFYTSLFNNSKTESVTRYGKEGFEIHGRPAGSVMTINFSLDSQKFTALNGGPVFKINPSVSFLVSCKTKDEVDALWEELSQDGRVRMELGSYPFSERYGWIEDRYGVSWQLMFTGAHDAKQKIVPTLMFVGTVCGKAEEAIRFYTSVFQNSKVGDIHRYGEGMAPDKQGSVTHSSFTLLDGEFAAMDSAREHNFAFNEAISLQVMCDTQKEIDSCWTKLSEGGDPAAQQCGWLKDKYGLSWQVAPTALQKMMDGTSTVNDRVMKALLQMKKLDITALEQAYKG